MNCIYKMNTIDYIQNSVAYKDFFENYLLKNKPCVLCAEFTEHWACRNDWVNNNGELNIDYMTKMFGHLKAPVVDCNKKYFSSHEKTDLKVSDFFKYWRNRCEKVLYLKDWHLQRETTEKFYEVPSFFKSDWLNEYWDMTDKLNDDYRFVYVGVEGSWTPFHADVFHSYSWSANVCGLKRWLLYPPGDEKYLKDQFGNLPYDVRELDHKQLKCKPIEVMQRPGEVIFVPSCWHHQVFNLKDTVSINHNWVNGASIEQMFNYLLHELKKVKNEIDDCKEMDGFHKQCQLILRASSGIDLPSFYDMVLSLIKRRLHAMNIIETNDTEEVRTALSVLWVSAEPKLQIMRNDISFIDQLEFLKFDLSKLRNVLKLLLDNGEFQLISSQDTIQEGWNAVS